MKIEFFLKIYKKILRKTVTKKLNIFKAVGMKF